MKKHTPKIENNVQDRNSEAWKKLCEYIDKVAEEELDEFSPYEALGAELYSQIYTLPKSISKLTQVKKVWLYGSKLKRIPPEIGKMKSLEYFDPYTSYNLHWFPYEITDCKHLKDSRISTRALLGNYKNRMPFPSLEGNPVRYYGAELNCSICKKEITYSTTNQLWITLRIGTDTVPLLANVCSKDCEQKLPKPPENYVRHPHKGGKDLIQPMDENEQFKIRYEELQRKRALENKESKTEEKQSAKKNDKGSQKFDISKLKPIKLVRKIWEK